MKTKIEIRCPACGCTDVTCFQHIEDAVIYRRMKPRRGNQLIIEGHYKVFDEETGNPRLLCQNQVLRQHARHVHKDRVFVSLQPVYESWLRMGSCLQEFPIPPGIDTEFV